VDKRKPYRYIPVKKFAESFQRFPVGTQIQDELAEPYPREKCHPAALAKKKYTISTLELFRVTFDRELILMKRNAIVFIVNVFQVCIHVHIAYFISPAQEQIARTILIFVKMVDFGAVSVARLKP